MRRSTGSVSILQEGGHPQEGALVPAPLLLASFADPHMITVALWWCGGAMACRPCGGVGVPQCAGLDAADLGCLAEPPPLIETSSLPVGAQNARRHVSMVLVVTCAMQSTMSLITGFGH